MIVFDRSGSMSESAGTLPGRSKMDEAKDAASLFVQLIASGAGHRVGLVSFSTTASSPVDDHLGNVNPGQKNDLVGPSPYTTGKVGALMPGGMTSIGDGLQKAVNEFPAPGAGVNKRTVLLLTDGMQNTPPMINAVMGLSGTDIHAIGYGTAASLNGALLTQLAQTHNGLYMRAGDGLALKKFFALAFGNIFEAGALNDPELILKAGQSQAAPHLFSVCEEAAVTIVVGWDRANWPLGYRIETPSGSFISWNETGTESNAGTTWRFTKIPLPFNGQQNGTWKLHVMRVSRGEFSSADMDIRYFVNVLAKDGPVLRQKNKKLKFYTGETFNPKLAIFKTNGFPPQDPKIKLIVQSPQNSIGTLLSRIGLKQAVIVDGDTLPARQATLKQMSDNERTQIDRYNEQSFDLFDDGSHDDGGMEPDGVFGLPLPDLLKYEGNYSFHAIATYGNDCTGTRELTWTIHVETGVDPSNTDIRTYVIGSLPDGKNYVKIDFTPKDKYGNLLGPGRLDAFTVSGTSDSTPQASVIDLGDGSYSVVVVHDPSAADPPAIVISQPERNPIIVAPKTASDCRKWKQRFWWVLALLLLLIVLFLIWMVI
jgi:hypothetical protein